MITRSPLKNRKNERYAPIGFGHLSRVQTRFPALFGLRWRCAKSLRFVTLNGQCFKRMQVADTRIASDIERNLQVFRADGIFPELVTRYEHEIWTDFIPGTLPRQVTERLVRDLRFLHTVGILTNTQYVRLCRAAERRVPQRVWIGFDYTDPVLKNFVLSRDGERLYAVDVEGIADDRLIGMGSVKTASDGSATSSRCSTSTWQRAERPTFSRVSRSWNSVFSPNGRNGISSRAKRRRSSPACSIRSAQRSDRSGAAG